MPVGSIAAMQLEGQSATQPEGSRWQAIDRWIYVYMAASFIVIALLGFIPDSLVKMADVEAGHRLPFPPILHVHAVLMGSFLVLVLAQTALAATGRIRFHRQLGMVGALLVPAIVVVGIILIPTMYREVWSAAQNAPPEARETMQQAVRIRDNILLLQIRMVVLFALFMVFALRARRTDSGFHKRMMILAVAMILPPAIDRIVWLPTTFPANAMGTDLYTLLAIMPMFGWDVIKARTIDKAYAIWFAVNLPCALAVHGLWETQWWHSIAPRLLIAG